MDRLRLVRSSFGLAGHDYGWTGGGAAGGGKPRPEQRHDQLLIRSAQKSADQTHVTFPLHHGTSQGHDVGPHRTCRRERPIPDGNLAITDYGPITNGLFYFAPPTPSHVTFDVEWSGVKSRHTVRNSDVDQHFGGEFRNDGNTRELARLKRRNAGLRVQRRWSEHQFCPSRARVQRSVLPRLSDGAVVRARLARVPTGVIHQTPGCV